MRIAFAALTAAATITMSVWLAPAANATALGAAASIQQSLAETGMVEQVRRVCRRNVFTGKVSCWTDRSRPPTVCHRIRGTNRMDCY